MQVFVLLFDSYFFSTFFFLPGAGTLGQCIYPLG